MFRPRVHLSLLLTLFIASLVLSPTILPARGVTTYTPGVIGGQWALYKQLYFRCTAPIPSICGPQSSSLDYGILIVTSVNNNQVTLNLASVLNDGTGTHQGAQVDVETGYSNITIPLIFSQQVPLNSPVTAKNLHAGDLLNLYSSSRFNSTITETVAGQDRMVNIFNITKTETNISGSFRTSTEVRFDQSTGLVAKLLFSFSIDNQYGGSSKIEGAIGMVDNNIWSSQSSTSYPDFGINIAPTTISTVQSSHANSTITITRMRAFNATVKLTLASSSNSLTCTLSQSKLVKGGGTDTSLLSCTGSPGTYTVTVTGDSGYSTHTAQEKIDVGTASSSSSTTQTTAPNFLSYLVNPTVDIGIAAAGIIIALLAVLLTRRKPVPVV